MSKRISSNRHELKERMAIGTAMLEAGATYREIQLRTGLSLKTIGKLKTGTTVIKPTIIQVSAARKTIEQHRADEADKLSKINEKVLDHLLSEEGQKKIEKAGLREAAGALKDMITERELLTGRPTSRHEDTLSDAELLREIRKAKDELARMGGFAKYATVEEAEYTDATPESLQGNPGGALAAPASRDEAPSGE